MATRAEKDAFLAGISATLFVLALGCLAGAVFDRSTYFPYEEAMSGFLGFGFAIAAIVFHRGDAVPRWAFRLLAIMFIALSLSPFWYPAL